MASVMVASLAPMLSNLGFAMNIVLFELSSSAPVAASLSASLFPVMSEWPLIHSKEVMPPLLFCLFMIGLIRFACWVLMKCVSMFWEIFLHIVFMTHLELILIWSLLESGTIERALWMVRILAVLFVCGRFRPPGVAMLQGLSGLNHIPRLAQALISPFLVQEPSV